MSSCQDALFMFRDEERATPRLAKLLQEPSVFEKGEIEGMSEFETFDDIPSTDELFDIDVDMEEIEATLRESQPERKALPEGHYITTPPGKHTIRDGFGGTYKVVSYWTKVTGLGGIGYVGFDLDPVKRKTETGRYTGAYQNYSRAAKAFEAALGQPPKKVFQVLDFLDNYPVDLKLIPHRAKPDRNLVVDITAAPKLDEDDIPF